MTSKNAAIVIRQLNWNYLDIHSKNTSVFSLLPFLILFFIMLPVNSIIITLLVPEHFHIFYILIRIYLA